MSLSEQDYFCLFRSQGVVKATAVPLLPAGFSFHRKVYRPSRRSLIEFNHLTQGAILVGFQFLSPEDGGQAFLSSQFVCESGNARLENWGAHCPVLEIHLGNCAEAESDQGSFLGVSQFETREDDFIIVIPCLPQYWSELGFELETRDVPVPCQNEGKIG
jgi:hypothetical protein